MKICHESANIFLSLTFFQILDPPLVKCRVVNATKTNVTKRLKAYIRNSEFCCSFSCVMTSKKCYYGCIYKHIASA